MMKQPFRINVVRTACLIGSTVEILVNGFFFKALFNSLGVNRRISGDILVVPAAAEGMNRANPLPTATFAYNNSYNRSLKMTSFKCVFGCTD
jgi:hypothetical protein